MNKKLSIFGLVLSSALVLGACTDKADEAVKVGDKNYSLADIEAMKDKETYIADALLFDILNELYDVKEEVNKTYDNYVNVLGEEYITTLTEDDIKSLKNDIKLSLQLQKFYNENIEVADKEVQEKLDAGYEKVTLYHAIVLDGTTESLEEAKKVLTEATTQEQYDKLVETYATNEKFIIEKGEYTPDEIIEGFEDVFKMEVNEIKTFGDNVYSSAIKVVDKSKVEKDEIKNILRTAKIYEQFKSASDLIKKIDEVEKYKVDVSEEVYTLIEKNYEDVQKEQVDKEDTSLDTTGEVKKEELTEDEKNKLVEEAKERDGVTTETKDSETENKEESKEESKE